MQNVEYKAELRDPDLARTIAASIGACRVETLTQIDTYFRIPDGKLKRRQTAGYPTEWVFYSRPGQTRPKLSNFTLYPEAMARERFGHADLPVWIVVKKSRELWSYQGVRIHFDAVENLGNYIEFEALVCHERTLTKASEQVEFLRRSLAPAMGEAIAYGYADLIAGEPAATRPG